MKTFIPFDRIISLNSKLKFLHALMLFCLVKIITSAILILSFIAIHTTLKQKNWCFVHKSKLIVIIFMCIYVWRFFYLEFFCFCDKIWPYFSRKKWDLLKSQNAIYFFFKSVFYACSLQKFHKKWSDRNGAYRFTRPKIKTILQTDAKKIDLKSSRRQKLTSFHGVLYAIYTHFTQILAQEWGRLFTLAAIRIFKKYYNDT